MMKFRDYIDAKSILAACNRGAQRAGAAGKIIRIPASFDRKGVVGIARRAVNEPACFAKRLGQQAGTGVFIGQRGENDPPCAAFQIAGHGGEQRRRNVGILRQKRPPGKEYQFVSALSRLLIHLPEGAPPWYRLAWLRKTPISFHDVV